MEPTKSKWTTSVSINPCEIHCPSTCVTLGDLYSDGDTKLIVAVGGQRGMNMKLKVFKGVAPYAESTLSDMPTAIVHFRNETSSLNNVAIASGSALFIYKNLKPYYRFPSPSAPINDVEQQAWKAIEEKKISQDELLTVLTNLSHEISISNLTSISQTLLIASKEDRPAIIERYMHKLTNPSTITCVSKMSKSSADVIEIILIGTEHKCVHIIDSQAFTVMSTCTLPSVPVAICTYGTFDVDYRIFVLTRDSQIFTIRRDQKLVDKPLITSPSLITSVVQIKKMVVVATSDNKISFYSFKGKKMNEAKCEKKIRMLEAFEYTQKQCAAVFCVFDDEVRMYDESNILDVIRFEKHISWIKFGAYGREDGALIICFKDGSVSVKMFRRTATFDEKLDYEQRRPVHSIKLQIPKKTKIFIDQTVRERDNSHKIHQAYQKDLFLLKYRIAEAYKDMISSSTSTVATTSTLPIDISADVHGFGPTFRLFIYLTSTASKELQSLWLSIICDPDMYNVETPLIPIGYLAPNHQYSFTTLMTCIDPEKATQEDIRVILISGSDEQTKPIVTAHIRMPLSEFAID